MPTQEAEEKSTKHFQGGKAHSLFLMRHQRVHAGGESLQKAGVRQDPAPHCKGQRRKEIQNSCSLVAIVISRLNKETDALY